MGQSDRRKRPRTLSEKLADLELTQAELELDQNGIGWPIAKVGPTLFAAQRKFCFTWVDDRWDPRRSEVVAVFRTKRDFKIALANDQIPESQNVQPGETSTLDCLEIPFESEGTMAMVNHVHLVFEARAERDVDHWNFQIDGSGTPLRAFVYSDSAVQHEEKLTLEKLLDWIATKRLGFNMNTEACTSLSEQEFIQAVSRLGVDLVRRRPEKHEPAIATALLTSLGIYGDYSETQLGIDLARMQTVKKVLKLLDRFRLFKTISMPVSRSAV